MNHTMTTFQRIGHTVALALGIASGASAQVCGDSFFMIPAIGSATGGFATSMTDAVDSTINGLSEQVGTSLVSQSAVHCTDSLTYHGAGQFELILRLESSDDLAPAGFTVGGSPATSAGVFLGANAGGSPVNFVAPAIVTSATLTILDLSGAVSAGPFDVSSFAAFADPAFGNGWNGSFGLSLGAGSVGGIGGYELAVSFSSPGISSVDAFGLPNTPIGSATITTACGSGPLVVSNLGSSGADGVSIDLGDASGSCVLLGSPDPAGTAPVGARLQVNHFGKMNDGNEVLLESMHAQKTATGVSLSLTPGPTYTSFTVEAYLGVDLVGTFNGTGAGPIGTIPSLAWPRFLERKHRRKQRPNKNGLYSLRNHHSRRGRGDCWFGLESSSGTGGVTITLPGQGTVVANLLRILPEEAPGVWIESVTRADVTVADLPSLEIDGEMIYAFDERTRALTDATRLNPVRNGADQQLVTSSTTADAEFGAETSFGRMAGFEAKWLPLDLYGAAPTGAFVSVSTTGRLNSTPFEPTGSIRFTKTTSGLAASVDYTPIGSSSHRVRVLASGAVVADVSGLTGVAGTSSTWPDGIRRRHGDLDGFESLHPSGTQFQVNGTSYVGDTLVVLPEGGSTISQTNTFAIRAKHLPTVTVVEGSRLELFGLGCAGTGGLDPELTGNGFPTIGNANFALQLSNARPNATGAVILSFELEAVSLGQPCFVLEAPVAALSLQTDASGSATVALPIPADPGLFGLEVFNQSLVIDPAGALGLFSHSAGLRLLVK